MSTIRTFIRLTGMRRKEGLLRSARWAAGLLWRGQKTSRRRAHAERRAEGECAARQRL